LTKVALHGTGLSSKDFCVLCLGIGSKLSFDHFSLRENNIGELAVRCLDVLMKFHKNLLFDFTGNPLEKELKGKSAYKRCLVPRTLE
jgi:predicted polyphosphate/ATP-dependent NAD kinase